MRWQFALIFGKCTFLNTITMLPGIQKVKLTDVNKSDTSDRFLFETRENKSNLTRELNDNQFLVKT